MYSSWLIRPFIIVAVAFLLGACSASQYAPVEDLGYSSGKLMSANSVRTNPKAYQVKPEDTMFAIAWRFGWDYKKLAKINAIGSPYTIYVGQVLYFNDTNSNKEISKSALKRAVKKSTISTKSALKKAPVAATQAIAKAPLNKAYKGPLAIKWAWPLKGKIIQFFSNKASASNGIDLLSTLGKTVKSASSGIIVYAGSGIQGYGKLVVVKHNDTFLSAYAYNSQILVVEGSMVKAGQVIAKVGKGPQLDPRLHFEIRKNGKSVNPLRYLPKL